MQKDKMATVNAIDFTFRDDQTKCFITICNSQVAGEYEDGYKEYIWLHRIKNLPAHFIYPACRNHLPLFLIRCFSPILKVRVNHLSTGTLSNKHLLLAPEKRAGGGGVLSELNKTCYC